LQVFFVVILSAHPRTGCAHANELTVLALLGIPSIPGNFEFIRPPRDDADVANYMARRDPYQTRARRHGEKITGSPPCFEGAVRHAAAVVNHAEKLVQAILLGRDGDKDGDPPP
jgi:hypothetical protein